MTGPVYLAPLEGFRVGLGPRNGSFKLDSTSWRDAIAHEINAKHGDPAVDKGGNQAAIVGSVQHAVVDHLELGPTWVRLRAVRLSDVSTPWT